MYKGTDGVDHEAFLAMKSVDFGTFHLYPDNWGVGTKWGNQWIVDHIEAAQKAGKPTVLEEYGVVVKRNDETNAVTGGFERREVAYKNWNNLMLKRGGSASMFWILVGVDPSNARTGYYQDYDHFSVYNVEGEATANILADYAGQFCNSARACELPNARGTSGAASPFVSSAPPAGGVAAGGVAAGGVAAGGVAVRSHSGQRVAVSWIR
jgi:mannan endo-1,4-beta-mannosidase